MIVLLLTVIKFSMQSKVRRSLTLFSVRYYNTRRDWFIALSEFILYRLDEWNDARLLHECSSASLAATEGSASETSERLVEEVWKVPLGACYLQLPAFGEEMRFQKFPGTRVVPKECGNFPLEESYLCLWQSCWSMYLSWESVNERWGSRIIESTIDATMIHYFTSLERCIFVSDTWWSDVTLKASSTMQLVATAAFVELAYLPNCSQAMEELRRSVFAVIKACFMGSGHIPNRGSLLWLTSFCLCSRLPY